MAVKKLKLNDDKTEFLVITSKYHQSKPNTNRLQIASSEILAFPSARNLGIVFDNTLSMDAHINNSEFAIVTLYSTATATALEYNRAPLLDLSQ